MTVPDAIALPASDPARIAAKPAEERRVALVLGGNADGVGEAARLIATFRAAGYRVLDPPEDGAAVQARLADGPSDAEPQADGGESLSFATYSGYFAALPMPAQQRVAARWGAAERDPFFRPGRLDCGRFAIPACRCGNVAVLAPPTPGDDPAAPRHAYLAALAWIADEFRADVVLDLAEPEAARAFAALSLKETEP